MRLWTIHPKYLDRLGLIALWREALGAKSILIKLAEGKKPGYSNHPQLTRFKTCEDPIGQINNYLYHIYLESYNRGYNFNVFKVGQRNIQQILINEKDIKDEWTVLMNKLLDRDTYKYMDNFYVEVPEIHPQFKKT